jgi:VWFA-related protein
LIVASQGLSSAQDPTQPAKSPPKPITTIKVHTRLVTVEVVARDRQGNAVPRLTADDFEVFEKVPPKRDRRPQMISVVQFVNQADLNGSVRVRGAMPAGVYSNMVAMQKMAVPPTVLLLDGLNTDSTVQMQTRQQMLRMLASVPQDVPMAIFVLDRRLHLLQSLTNDPKLLLQAAGKFVSNQAPGPEIDPLDDPNAASAFMENLPPNQLPPGALQSLQNFERESYVVNLDTRVRETLDALRAIARYVSGYPGRKNLLWISSSFPLVIGPEGGNDPNNLRVYKEQMDEVANALADAKVAVYPIDPAGVAMPDAFQASAKIKHEDALASPSSAMEREDDTRFHQQDTMGEVADKTGGRVCLNNNDLAKCVQTAISDGTSYYELGYYPDSSEWHGEFRQITVKTKGRGIQLAYRLGYYATSESPAQSDGKEPATGSDPAAQRAACEDVLVSTGIVLAAEILPNKAPEGTRFLLAIDPKDMTLPPAETKGRTLSMTIGACSFDRTGKVLNYTQNRYGATLTEKEYAVMSVQGIPQVFAVQLQPAAARVRLLVRDGFSGRMGSVEIPIAAKPKATTVLAPNPNPAP